MFILLAVFGGLFVLTQASSSSSSSVASKLPLVDPGLFKARGRDLFSREQLLSWAKILHAGGTNQNRIVDTALLTKDELAYECWKAFGNGVHVLNMGPMRWRQVLDATQGLLAYESYGREAGNLGNASLRFFEIETWLLNYRYPGNPGEGKFGAKRCKIRQKFITLMIQSMQSSPALLLTHSQASAAGAKSWYLGSPVLCPEQPAVPAVFVGTQEEQAETFAAATAAFSHALNQLFVLSLDATPFMYTAGDLLKGILSVVTAGISAAFPAAAPAVAAGNVVVDAAVAGNLPSSSGWSTLVDASSTFDDYS